MTISTLLSLSQPQLTPSNSPTHNFMPLSEVDRTHWSGGKGKWKGGKGNAHAALSALTLLAFLFFLNILQSCLRDTIGQNNGMMVMVLPANSTATTRLKRESRLIKENHARDEQLASHANTTWTDFKIVDFISSQVESYWNTQEKLKLPGIEKLLITNK